MSEELPARFQAIDWLALDVGRICAFYDAIGRPLEERALLVAPRPATEAWQRQCVADLAAMQGRGCPSCAA